MTPPTSPKYMPVAPGPSLPSRSSPRAIGDSKAAPILFSRLVGTAWLTVDAVGTSANSIVRGHVTATSKVLGDVKASTRQLYPSMSREAIEAAIDAAVDDMARQMREAARRRLWDILGWDGRDT